MAAKKESNDLNPIFLAYSTRNVENIINSNNSEGTLYKEIGVIINLLLFSTIETNALSPTL